MRQGSLEVNVKLDNPMHGSGRIVFGYDPSSGTYYSAGIGGYDFAYVVDEFVPGRGWAALKRQGSRANIPPNEKIHFRINIRGQWVSLTVDSVTVIEASLPHPLMGDEVGIFAWGPAKVDFEGFAAAPTRPRAFVIMEFSEPFNAFFKHVILPVADKSGLDAFRASDVYKPGVILADIVRDILESEVIIAEITPGNPNVFYELGYAHALGKSTILVADKSKTELPFDIRGYRVIFYENSIRGKPEVERQLEEHLKNIMADSGRGRVA